jgi:putative ABC transport system permease protein
VLKVTWRNLVARKIRLLLSAFAIVLGVAFVAGSLIFTDALGGAFDDIIEGSTADVEVAFEGAISFDAVQDNRTIPASVVDDLEELPEAAGVHPVTALQTVFVIGENGKVVGGNGPPGLAFSPTTAESVAGEPILTLLEGELPGGPEQIALDVDTAERAGVEAGDTVELVTPGTPPQLSAELTGIVEFGSGGLNGATLTLFEQKYMQDQFFGGEDVYSTISLSAAEGVSQSELASAAEPLLPQGVEATPGDVLVAEAEKELDEILGFIQTFLLVFAAVSLVVGVFLIINTFSILVAQRSRELALLRAMGASRRQVNRSVLLEALAVALIGSTVGLGAGYLLALGLRFIFGLFGLDLSRAEFPVEWTTVLAAYAVGIIVTVIAGYLPARRAARVAPVAALRDEVALPEQTLRRRAVVAVVLVVLGVAAVVAGFVGEGGTGLSLIGLGMLLVLIGVALLSPLVARPVIRVFEVVYRRLFGTVGVLATQNALRNPRRTAATASALMVGMALVAMMSILGQSASASTDAALDEALTSQFVISNVIGQPFSTDVAEQARRVEGVSTVAQLRQGPARVEGDRIFVGAVDPRDFGLALVLPMQAGTMADLGPGTVIVSANVAEQRNLTLGDPVTMTFQGGEVDLEVAGIMQQGAPAPSEWFVTPETFLEGGLAPLDSFVFVNAAPDADLATVRSDLQQVVADLPTVTVKDPQGFADEQKEQINQFLYLIYALLGLSVIIAVLGVINTLALSVIERTREVGLLRAIGVSRRQLRTVIRLESIVIAVFGALLGIALGVAFGVGLMIALEDQGLTEIVVPWLSLLLFVLAAALVGVVAAVVPARRAARLDVLRAITTE